MSKTRFIVNPGGAVHPVGERDFERLIAQRSLRRQGDRYREATPEERARWYTEQGLAVPAEFLPPTPPPQQASTDADERDNPSGSRSDIPAGNSAGRTRKPRRASGS